MSVTLIKKMVNYILSEKIAFFSIHRARLHNHSLERVKIKIQISLLNLIHKRVQ